METIRINKYLRDQGLAARREADRLVAAGLVFINGKRAELGAQVEPDDKVEVRGSHLAKPRKYLAYYKPRGLATQDLEGRDSVMIQQLKAGLFPVGRLDKESEGLLILTNDGRVSTSVLGEKSKFEKEYTVRVKEILRANIPGIFAKGMDTETFGTLLPAQARITDNHRLLVTLKQGKRHQIRVMLSELGYTVTSLRRIRIGAVTLGKLRPGESRPLSVAEIEALLPRK